MNGHKVHKTKVKPNAEVDSTWVAKFKIGATEPCIKLYENLIHFDVRSIFEYAHNKFLMCTFHDFFLFVQKVDQSFKITKKLHGINVSSSFKCHMSKI